MPQKGSPPKHTKLTDTGGSRSSGLNLSLASLATTASSSEPLLKHEINDSSSSKSNLHETNVGSTKSTKYQYTHAHSYGNRNQSYNYSGKNGGNNSGSSRIMPSSSAKRSKKGNWGTRERTGMSFLIVIAFFAVFGMIILTEVFMIDERSHSTMVMLHHGGGGFAGRLGDSMPDYDNVKDDYDLLDGSLLGDNRLGYVQLRDNKLKIQDADSNDAGRLAGVLLNSGGINGYGMGAGGLGNGLNVPQIPWGKVLPMKIEETLPPYPVGMVPTSGSWQVVNGTRFKFFVFSAYYDRRDGAKLVRVIGATKTRGPERVWCRFWYLNRNISSSANGAITGSRQRERFTSLTVMARVKIIRENWNLKYSACFILCPLNGHEPDVPYYVSVVSRLRAPPGNLLTLRNTDWDMDFAAIAKGNQSSSNGSISTMPIPFLPQPPTGDRIPDKIAVCVKPFHFNYDQALYLMEYLELYTLLGVSHFTFYNHTLGPHASCALKHYVDGDVPDLLTAQDGSAASMNIEENKINNQQSKIETTKFRGNTQHYVKPTVKILPWNLNMRSQKEIRTEGLFAALNDCVYRSMYRYKYLALVDLDEFIVPRQNDTIHDLINSMNQRFPTRNIGVYSFQNAFFYLQFPDDNLVYRNTKDEMNARMRASLITQRKTKRRYKLHPQKQRSKYICKPEAVVEAGNHFVWEFSPGKGALNVAPTEAILQHYRVCEFGGNDCIKAPSVVDRTATKYVNRLVQRVESVYNHLKVVCDLPELPALPKHTNSDIDNEENLNDENQEKSNQIQSNSNSKVNEKSTIRTTKTKNITTSIKNKKNSVNATKSKSDSNSSNVTKLKDKNIKKSKNEKKDVPTPEAKKKSLNAEKSLPKKRKFVVFENGPNGIMARVEYY